MVTGWGEGKRSVFMPCGNAASLGKEDDSDDSLLEELATVAVKEGSDSDENPNSGEHDEDDEDDRRHNDDEGEEEVEDDEDDEDEEGMRKDETQTSPDYTVAPLLPVYEHNPGEVYPIAEEEEEAASPTASDGVTSLRSRARLNSG